MSPLSLRRYRAERLLREDFARLRGAVVAIVRTRLRGSGVQLDASDLDACYAQAWHGLYTAVLDGEEIDNPTGWLALVTFRRAIDEHRARGRFTSPPGERVDDAGMSGAAPARTARGRALEDGDLAAALDDRVRLRHLFEALRGRLSERELQAAALCYLQGMSRSEAAARMGVSDGRMHKLMEGRGSGRPGVAGKVGALVATIRDGGWCEEQGSLMRGFAFGILDPEGERYRMALMHRDECPACRAYVLSLRGLAAVLPPVPSLLHWTLSAVAGTGAGAALGTGASAASGAGAGAGSGAAGGSGAGAHGAGAIGASSGTGAQVTTGSLAPAGSGFAGAVSASGASGAGAAGGGWLLAGGPAGAKLAVGCLLALGIGASCAELAGRAGDARSPAHRRASARAVASASAGRADGSLANGGLGADGEQAPRPAYSAGQGAAAGLSPAARASREFGPEQGQGSAEDHASTAAATRRSTTPTAISASSAARPAGAGGSPEPTSVQADAATGARAQAAGVSAAEREFSPG